MQTTIAKANPQILATKDLYSKKPQAQDLKSLIAPLCFNYLEHFAKI